MTRTAHPLTASLRILQTTDLHMALVPYDYLIDKPLRAASLSELAPLITELRDTATCLFDTGDFLQGNALADFAIQRGPHTAKHPMIAAMNALEYDAVALGNHEFDYGLTALTRALDDLDCPALLANVTDDAGRPFFTPVTMITRDLTCSDDRTHPVRIGVIGLVTPSTVIAFDSADPVQLKVGTMTAAARTHAAALKADGADIIVALCHAGVTDHPEFETAAQVAALDDIDVVLGGHVHDIFPDPSRSDTAKLNNSDGTVAGKPTVMAGAFGQNLGLIDLHLLHDGTRWQIAQHRCDVIPASRASQPDQTVSAAITGVARDPHQRTLAHIRHPIATAATHINSYFAQIGPGTSLQLLADANRAAMRKALADHALPDLPMLTAVAPFCVGGRRGIDYYVDIPQGPVTLRAARAVFPFDNKLIIIKRNSADLLAHLERASFQFNRLQPDIADQLLFDDTFAPYNADAVFGLTYRIDLTKPAGQGRIHDLRYQNQPLTGTEHFLLGTSTHRALGGGGYRPVDPADVVFQSPYAIFEHLVAYLRAQGTVTPRPERVWDFTPIKGATAIFQSSPKATEHMDMIRHQITRLGTADDGFATYRLSLDTA